MRLRLKNVQIESGIPIPPRVWRGPRPRYPLDAMKVGDSFFVPKARTETVRGRFYRAARRRGMRVSLREFTKGGVLGVMVWRTA